MDEAKVTRKKKLKINDVRILIAIVFLSVCCVGLLCDYNVREGNRITQQQAAAEAEQYGK